MTRLRNIRQIDSRRRRDFTADTLRRRAAIGLRCAARWIAGIFRAAADELGRLNSVGSRDMGGANRTRRERAAIARKALAERHQGHTRCC